MRNFVQRGATLTVPAPINVLSGDGVQVGNIFGVASEDCTQGYSVDLAVEGVFTLPKVTALAFGVGDAVFWDSTGKQATATAGANQRIGVAVAAVPNPSGTVDVRLNANF